jgi:hypothetical protein
MAELTPGQVFAGHRIERIAGRGGMGVVYLATDLRLKRQVALKVIAPELAREPNFQQRFERECELAASVDHPGVIPVYSAGEEDGASYVTMRWVEGTDLAEMIRLHGRLPLPLVATVATQLGDALDAAHARGLVHRDVKPANVLVREEPGGHRVFLTDFGLTRRLASDTRLTATGAIMGTLDYMAPEQFTGGTTDARTDVYALGCVLYQSLSGSVPFPTEGAPAKLFAHTNAERPSLLEAVPDAPPALDRVLQKAMAKEPEDRYRSAGELGAAAAAAVAGEGVAAEEATTGAVPAGAESATGTAPAADAGTTGMSTAPAAEAATTGVAPAAEAPPTAPSREPVEPIRERRRRPLTAVALVVAVLLTAAGVGYAVLGGGDESGGGGGGNGGGGGEAPVEPDPAAPSGQGEQGPQASAIAAEVPPAAVANVTSYDRGVIEQEGYDRRVELVELRDPATSGRDAEAQALDELIINRWLRAEADALGSEFTPEEIAAEQASPEFAEEVARMREVGYLQGGIDLDTEARLAGKERFGEDSEVIASLTDGYDESEAGAFGALLGKWRADTACTEEAAPLSPLCANGPEPGSA